MRIYAIFLAVQVLLFAVLPGFSVADTGTVAMQISTHKTALVVGEPLLVSATVQNDTSRAVKIYRQNSPTYARAESSVVSLFVSADGSTFKSWNDGLRPLEKTEPLSLSPGKKRTTDLVMLFSHDDGFAVKKAGKYWILGRVTTTAGAVIEAKPVMITVREPAGVDQDVWTWLKDHKKEYGHLIQTPWVAELSGEFLSGCDRLCETSQSTYVQYLALYLGRWYRESAIKDEIQSARYLEIAKSSASSEFLKTKVLKAIARE